MSCALEAAGHHSLYTVALPSRKKPIFSYPCADHQLGSVLLTLGGVHDVLYMLLDSMSRCRGKAVDSHLCEVCKAAFGFCEGGLRLQELFKSVLEVLLVVQEVFIKLRDVLEIAVTETRAIIRCGHFIFYVIRKVNTLQPWCASPCRL